jgi:nicotinate dehydrogenase subunit B
MLHARVIRPPHVGRDSGELVGRSLVSVDESSLAPGRGTVRVVVIQDFVAVVAEREEDAVRAARELKVRWRSWPELPDLSNLSATLRARPGRARPLKESGNVDRAFDAANERIEATYVWPYQMHASIGPSCGVADFQAGQLTVWTGSQNPHLLHADLGLLTGLLPEQIRVVRMEASGCYGRNCADDAAAEAALLAIELKCPVRVQLMREEEHGWEPKGTAQLIEVRGALTGPNTLVYDFLVRYPSNNAPTLALLHTGRTDPRPVVERKGDRTAVPQYRMSDARVVVYDMAPIVRAAWLRGVAALPNVFAHESFIDELAALHHADPIEFRLRFMDEPRAIALTHALARHAGWIRVNQTQAATRRRGDRILRGRGFAQHQYMHGSFPGVGAAWSAWICEVEVDTVTGVVRVCKVWVGFDCGLMINPAGVIHQIHGNVIQSVSRVLKEEVVFDRTGVVSTEWGGYPILTFTELPDIDVLIMPANGHQPLGVGESASVPSAAAVANAIYDACGLRLREAPFTPDRVRAALAPRPPASG